MEDNFQFIFLMVRAAAVSVFLTAIVPITSTYASL